MQPAIASPHLEKTQLHMWGKKIAAVNAARTSGTYSPNNRYRVCGSGAFLIMMGSLKYEPYPTTEHLRTLWPEVARS
ncbi:hypothetical protein A0H81_07069 [Grifola frondosa]|uniref:Uncharacterized protein n=1 Tax=Grifola frondosa TaxID=5627 RepID=A0A1C7M7E9_GRIFR|nr:hypothetical protein A0H81_07069 [Grifola frondosa]